MRRVILPVLPILLVKKSNIRNYCNHPRERPRSESRVAQSMLVSALANGGRILDCFDTVLPQLYASVGFREYAREPWNEEYKREGGNYDTYKAYNDGRPDVVYMRWSAEAWASPTLLHSAEIDYETLV